MHLLTCINWLLIAVAASSSYPRDAKFLPSSYNLPDAKVLPSRTSKLAIFIDPVRKFIDLALHRHHETPANERDTLPWSILNYPSYANQEDERHWAIHLQGNLFKYQPLKKSTINRIANHLLIRASIVKEYFPIDHMWFYRLNTTEAATMAHTVRDIAVMPVNGSIIDANIDGCDQFMTVPTMTNVEGSFRGKVVLPNWCLGRPLYSRESNAVTSANITLAPRNLRAKRNSINANVAKVFFVPPEGLTIVLDIDDILRETLVWNFKQATLNSFARQFRPWRDMPEVLWDLKHRLEAEGENVHFHYLTDAPDLWASQYINGTREHYPDGSFDFRMSNFTKVKEMFKPRYANTKRLLENFPNRTFVFMGDTSSAATLEWSQLIEEHKEQIQCLLIRDTLKTQPSYFWIPNTEQFLHVFPNKYWFYEIPGDLRHLSIRHLASLSSTNDSLRTTGCSSLDNVPPHSLKRTKVKHRGLRNSWKLFTWHLRCSLVFPWKRPNHHCPFDRIPGTKYKNGKIEPEPQVEPLNWYGDLSEKNGSSVF